MGCAITVVAPGRRLYLPDAKELFDTSLIVFDGKTIDETAYI